MEKQASHQEKEELQQVVALLRQEKQQLSTELEDRMATVKVGGLSRISCGDADLRSPHTVAWSASRCSPSFSSSSSCALRRCPCRRNGSTSAGLRSGSAPAPTSAALALSARFEVSSLVLQLQQLEENLQKSREELSQLQSDLQENVDLVGCFRLEGPMEPTDH